MDHIGIDPHKNASQVCILTEDGEVDIDTPDDFSRLLAEEVEQESS
jgi:hypothetical protein